MNLYLTHTLPIAFHTMGGIILQNQIQTGSLVVKVPYWLLEILHSIPIWFIIFSTSKVIQDHGILKFPHRGSSF